MRHHRWLVGLSTACAIVLVLATVAEAQVGISIGNPYTGRGIAIGQPLGYSAGYYGVGSPYAGYPTYSSYYGAAPVAGTVTYSSGYSGYAPPVTSYYNSGYSGTYAAAAPYAYPAYGYTSYYGYAPAYTYGTYAVGPRSLWRPRRWSWWW